VNCSNCGEPLEAGAAFCGNCGQAVSQQLEQNGTAPASAVTTNPIPIANQQTPESTPPSVPLVSQTENTPTPPAPLPTQQSAPPPLAAASPIAQGWANQSAPGSPSVVQETNYVAVAATDIPSYAVPNVGQQSSDVKATMSPVLGILGIVGAFFIPLVGLTLGIAGFVLGTLSRRASKHRLSTIGLIVSALAVAAGLASWAYVVAHDPHFNHKAASSAAAVNNGPIRNAASVITPCYRINFIGTLNIQNVSGSCDMNAFNGDTFDDSSDAYKIYGTVSAILPASFTSLAKQAIEKDVQQSLPTFTITHENAGSFAGSPAYFVTASNGQGVSVMEAAALHTTSNGDNFFVFVHAIGARTVNLNDLQSGWQWQ